jgi:hypothetical protein
MDRRTLLTAITGLLPLSATCLLAKNQGKGNGKEHKDKRRDKGEHAGDVKVTFYFRGEDHAVLQRYYDGPRRLPPGLRKKYYRTGKLPPGWEKKVRPFPPDLIRVLPPPPAYCDYGYIDGVAVVYDRKTRVILDAIDIIGAITGN